MCSQTIDERRAIGEEVVTAVARVTLADGRAGRRQDDETLPPSFRARRLRDGPGFRPRTADLRAAEGALEGLGAPGGRRRSAERRDGENHRQPGRAVGAARPADQPRDRCRRHALRHDISRFQVVQRAPIPLATKRSVRAILVVPGVENLFENSLEFEKLMLGLLSSLR